MTDHADAVAIRPARADEWGRWRETRLRMLRDDADFFSTRYDDMVREPDQMWRDWVGEAAAGDQKTLFVAEEGGRLARRRRRVRPRQPARGAADLDVGRSHRPAGAGSRRS